MPSEIKSSMVGAIAFLYKLVKLLYRSSIQNLLVGGNGRDCSGPLYKQHAKGGPTKREHKEVDLCAGKLITSLRLDFFQPKEKATEN